MRIWQCVVPISVWLLSGICVWSGIELSLQLRQSTDTYVEATERFDAIHYRQIAERGYSYDAQLQSLVAFFPAFPCSAWVLTSLTGIPSRYALLVTANLYRLGCLALLGLYLRRPSPSGIPSDRVQSLSLLAFAFLPTTFFFHVSYSETCLLFFALLTMQALSRGWPVWMAALLAGAATACRPVGIALLLPIVLHVLSSAKTRLEQISNLAYLLPLAAWGLILYMLYQDALFGDPLAFARTQEHWRIRELATGWDRCLTLGSLEPIWSTYLPGSAYYSPNLRWSIFSLEFMNPIFFVGTAILVAVGVWKRWLTREETALSAGLLLIPYLTRAYENGMLSHARFAAVIFPAYIVIGHLLARLPVPVAGSLLALSAVLMASYAALFAAGRGFF